MITLNSDWMNHFNTSKTHVDVFITPSKIHVYCEAASTKVSSLFLSRYQRNRLNQIHWAISSGFDQHFLSSFPSLFLSTSIPNFDGFSNRRHSSRSKIPRRLRSSDDSRIRTIRGARDLISQTRGVIRHRWTDRRAQKTEHTATKRSEHKPACLPACLPPACLLPACLVRRRTARGPHVVCLASGLFTCWLSVYAFPSPSRTRDSHPSRGLALTTRAIPSPSALYHSPSLFVSLMVSCAALFHSRPLFLTRSASFCSSWCVYSRCRIKPGLHYLQIKLSVYLKSGYVLIKGCTVFVWIANNSSLSRIYILSELSKNPETIELLYDNSFVIYFKKAIFNPKMSKQCNLAICMLSYKEHLNPFTKWLSKFHFLNFNVIIA